MPRHTEKVYTALIFSQSDLCAQDYILWKQHISILFLNEYVFSSFHKFYWREKSTPNRPSRCVEWYLSQKCHGTEKEGILFFQDRLSKKLDVPLLLPWLLYNFTCNYRYTHQVFFLLYWDLLCLNQVFLRYRKLYRAYTYHFHSQRFPVHLLTKRKL